MARERVSIKDIAHAAGVTHPTVSRALNDSPLISESTRKRIRRIADEMGYTPDAVAQSLQTRRTHIIGLVVTSIGDPFFADLVKGVEEVARSAGFSVFLNSSHNDPNQEIQVIETFHRQRVDGILVASSRIGSNHVDRLARINVPVVLVNSQAEGEYDFLHSIAVDDRLGAQRAVEHLVELGHRRIGYIGVTNRPKSNERRLSGYRDALAGAGIEAEEGWIRIVDLDPALEDSDVHAGKSVAAELLDEDITALFCYNDMVAVGVLLACREAGIAVPEGLSVIGFDDIEMARYVEPSLSSVSQPKRQMGSMAMNMIIDLLDENTVSNRIIDPVVRKRNSTAPRPKGSRSPTDSPSPENSPAPQDSPSPENSPALQDSPSPKTPSSKESRPHEDSQREDSPPPMGSPSSKESPPHEPPPPRNPPRPHGEAE